MRDKRAIKSDKIQFYVDESMGCTTLEAAACILETNGCYPGGENLNTIESCNPTTVLVELCALLELICQ